MTCLTRYTCLIKSFNLEGFTQPEATADDAGADEVPTKKRKLPTVRPPGSSTSRADPPAKKGTGLLRRCAPTEATGYSATDPSPRGRGKAGGGSTPGTPAAQIYQVSSFIFFLTPEQPIVTNALTLSFILRLRKKLLDLATEPAFSQPETSGVVDTPILPEPESRAQAPLSRVESCDDGRESARSRILEVRQSSTEALSRRPLRLWSPLLPRRPWISLGWPSGALLPRPLPRSGRSSRDSQGYRGARFPSPFGGLDERSSRQISRGKSLAYFCSTTRDAVCSPRLPAWTLRPSGEYYRYLVRF